MKKIAILGMAILLLGMTLPAAVMAKGGSGEIVTVNWLEDATRYYPDGSVWSSWVNDPNGPMELVQTGKAYHAENISQFYNIVLPDIQGSLVISGAGKLSAHSKYTSLVSGLPIKEHITGDVTIDPDAGTMLGTYTQYAYAFGSEQDVHTWYPNAIPEKSPEAGGWWFIGYTIYTVHQ